MGYISLLGHNNWSFKHDSAFYPILYKTTDGGNTWMGPFNVPIDAMGLVQKGLVYTDVAGDTIKAFTCGFQHDLAVDVYGMPHIFLLVGPSFNNWSILPENSYMIDLYQDAGLNWEANIVSNIMSYQGVFGANIGSNQELSEWNRGQISTTYDGSKMFYTWFDTDTMVYTGMGNTYPDMISSGMDVVKKTYFPRTNFTMGSAAESSITFGCVSYYVFEPSAGSYEIPVAYQNLNINQTNLPVDYYYIKDAIMNDQGFTTKSDIFLKKDHFIVSQNTPNPFRKNTSITIHLTKSVSVTTRIFNMMGQKLMERNDGILNKGFNEISIDGEGFSSGIYFYQILAGDEVVTKKMIIQ